MTRTVYVNGEYLPETEAKISIFDRAFLFADAVYEVAAVLNGKLVDVDEHLARLERSAKALSLTMPVSREAMIAIHENLIEKNHLREGAIYLQLSRGNEGDRIFAINEGVEPTLVLFTQAKDFVECPESHNGITVISMDDIRWQYRDIKTTSLLAACLGKQQAKAKGADDVWWTENGVITEAGSSNAYIITKDNTVVTKPLGQDILPGITRWRLLQCMKDLGLSVEERAFTLEEAYNAKEAFISSATTIVWGVTAIDGKAIGNGNVGDLTQQLRAHYVATCLR